MAYKKRAILLPPVIFRINVRSLVIFWCAKEKGVDEKKKGGGEKLRLL